MKAWRRETYDLPEKLQLREVPEPLPDDNNITIKVHAAGINFLDLAMMSGLEGLSPSLPFTPGIEVAGIVSAIGDKVSRYKIGDHVFGFPQYGGFAEFVSTSEDRIVPIPKKLDFITAAAAGIAYGTAYYALITRAGMTPGQRVLIIGATGATGLAAADIAVHYGATVAAVGGSDRKLQVAKKYGAKSLYSYLKDEDLATLEKQKFDLVFDTVGGKMLPIALNVLNSSGKLICVGATAQTPASFEHLNIVQRNIDIIGISYGNFMLNQNDHWRQDIMILFDLMTEHKLKPHIDSVHDFFNLPQALSELADRKSNGKIIINLGK